MRLYSWVKQRYLFPLKECCFWVTQYCHGSALWAKSKKYEYIRTFSKVTYLEILAYFGLQMLKQNHKLYTRCSFEKKVHQHYSRRSSNPLEWWNTSTNNIQIGTNLYPEANEEYVWYQSVCIEDNIERNYGILRNMYTHTPYAYIMTLNLKKKIFNWEHITNPL